MEKLLSCPLASVAESVMELADSFGLFAVFYAHHSEAISYHWHCGSFIRRQTENRQKVFLHLIFPDGRIGKAESPDWSIPAVEKAFHHARNEAKSKPGFLDFLQQLTIEEKRAPFPATEENEPAPSHTEFACCIDRHHQELLPIISPDLLDTTLCIFEETSYSLRSDGIHYQTKGWRAACSHTLFSIERLQPFHFHHGITVSANTPFAKLAEPLKSELIQWKTAYTASGKPAPEIKTVTARIPFIFDATIIAHLIRAWLQTGCGDTGRSAVASLWFAPAESMMDRLPLHPCGYQLSAAPLLSATGCNRELLQAFREPYPLTGHFLCQTPVHLQQAVNPREIFTSLSTAWYGEEKLHVCEGVAQFHAAKDTDRFFLLPARIYRADGTGSAAVQPVWIEGDLSLLFSSIFAGFGPLKSVWPTSSQNCSFSLPAYLFYYPVERRSAP